MRLDARIQHTAVWTGSEMIVWGGIMAPTFESTVEDIIPSLIVWTATTPPMRPLPGTDHTAVWTGNEMIVWGGGYSAHSY